jgi:flavin-binding protein dodecin
MTETEVTNMADPVYKTVEITGTSQVDLADAMRNAVEKAALTLRHIDWVEVTALRASVKEAAIDQLQVTMKVGFRLE